MIILKIRAFKKEHWSLGLMDPLLTKTNKAGMHGLQPILIKKNQFKKKIKIKIKIKKSNLNKK